MTETQFDSARPWPAATVAVWAAAWRAGECSPDHVLGVVHDYGQAHEIDAASDVVAGDGPLGVIDLLRSAAHVAVRLPAPGDPQGLPPGVVGPDELDTGEVVLIDDRSAGAEGPMRPLVLIARPTVERCRWIVRRGQTEVAVDRLSAEQNPGDAEADLRDGIREAVTLLESVGSSGGRGPADLRDALAARVRADMIDLPPHDNPRLDRILASAAQIDAIVSLAGTGAAGTSGAQQASADEALRRLSALARSARAAAVNAAIRQYR
ncbi:MAG: serine/threonine protein kinase [Gordonia sp. (in: high G+C Gram-positive bacteria)]|uniref:serine/threonine protein kinase n=1 Tax=Gordonia sp. (in: high G+C Gram-positive bacteria) TaxID=84139 RepID=UPI0039E2A50E